MFYLFISFTTMSRFHKPIDNQSVSKAHYLLAISIVLLALFFLGPLVMSLYAQVSVSDTVNQESFDVLQQKMSKNAFFTMNLLPFIVGFVALLFVVKIVLKRTVLSMITVRKRFDVKRFLFAFFFWLFLLLLVFFVHFSTNSASVFFNYQLPEFWLLLVISIILVPIQTGFEELFFRGLVLQFLGKFNIKPLFIVIAVALLFGGMHAMNPEVEKIGYFALVFYFCSGIFTTLLVVLDDGIELSWGFHFANNFFALVVFSNMWQALQTDSLFLDLTSPKAGNELFITIGILYPLFLFVFHRIYKWGNWKIKLFE